MGSREHRARGMTHSLWRFMSGASPYANTPPILLQYSITPSLHVNGIKVWRLKVI